MLRRYQLPPGKRHASKQCSVTRRRFISFQSETILPDKHGVPVGNAKPHQVFIFMSARARGSRESAHFFSGSKGKAGTTATAMADCLNKANNCSSRAA
eukprot:1265231-Pleurochrysis_carterae.AAC.1